MFDLCLFEDINRHLEINSTSTVVGDGDLFHLHFAVNLHLSV